MKKFDIPDMEVIPENRNEDSKKCTKTIVSILLESTVIFLPEFEQLALHPLQGVVDRFYVAAQQLLALLYIKSQDYEKARRVLRRALNVDNTNTRPRGKIQGRLSFTFMVQCRKKEKGMKFYWLLSIRGRRRFSGKVSPASSREVFA